MISARSVSSRHAHENYKSFGVNTWPHYISVTRNTHTNIPEIHEFLPMSF